MLRWGGWRFNAVGLVLCLLLCDDTPILVSLFRERATCHRRITQEYKLWLSQRR